VVQQVVQQRWDGRLLLDERQGGGHGGGVAWCRGAKVGQGLCVECVMRVERVCAWCVCVGVCLWDCEYV
jgi:hypothetical protein